MPPTIPPPRLHILAARTEPVAVILRRGPSKWCHVLRYRTDTDELEPGSWFRGRIYQFRCDLSDDGRSMVYLAMGDKGQTWNGVCEPPRLTCLAQWETDGTWFGGGLWTGPRRLAVNLGRGPGILFGRRFKPDYPGPQRPEVEYNFHEAKHGGEDESILYERLERDGWIRQGPFGEDVKLPGKQYQVRHDGDAGWLIKRGPTLPEIRLFFRGYFGGEGRRFEFQMPDHPAVLTPEVEWATWDCTDNLLVARRGCIERWTPADFARGAPSFAADLSMLVPPGRNDDSDDEPRDG